MSKPTPGYLPLGARVRVTHIMKVDKRRGKGPGNFKRTWERTPLPIPVEGLVCGVRTVYDGSMDWDEDDAWYFVQDTAHRVYVVAYDLYKNPMHALITDVQPVEAVSDAVPSSTGGDL